jgi:isopentenyl-diphosphate Delta-isomerase
MVSLLYMVIHFVCSGNTFRSRLAEAYLKSLKIPNIEVMSSGSYVSLNSVSITPYAALILDKYNIKEFASKTKTQLTQSRLDEGDITICVNRKVYNECQAQALKLPKRTYVWDIDDVTEFSNQFQKELSQHQVPEITETIFRNIREDVDGLVGFLKMSKSKELIDVLDDEGQPTGKTSDITTIHANGWLYAGVHVGLYTTDGKIILAKRSSNIFFYPNSWDIGVGGAVKSGETPEEAIIREVNEELGFNLKIEQLKKLFVFDYNHYLPHYGFHNHNLTHTYIAKIPENTKFTVQESEVSEVKMLNIDEVILMNESNKDGITPTNVYNKRILDAIVEVV